MITLPLLAALALQLPGTDPLVPVADFSAEMVEGIDRFALKRTADSVAKRAQYWSRDVSSAAAYSASVQPNRERLKTILGVVDERTAFTAIEYLSDSESPGVLAENEQATLRRVRWPVLDGVHGEGLMIEPKGQVLARVIYLPDADTSPEQLLDLKGGALPAALLNAGVEVFVPLLLNRQADFSGSEALQIQTNVPHREWIYRQSFILGRHPIGYEIQKVMALLDWFDTRVGDVPVCVAGQGEGGMLALYAGALDERIDSIYVAGYFGPRESLWKAPLYRNVSGLLREFGDAEVASLIAPRPLAVRHLAFPEVTGPPAAVDGQRSVAAPGRIAAVDLEETRAEMRRALALTAGLGGEWGRVFEDLAAQEDVLKHLLPAATADEVVQRLRRMTGLMACEPVTDAQLRDSQRRQVRELESHVQRLLATIEGERNRAFWKPLPLGSLDAFEARTAVERERFCSEVIGRLPDPDVPAMPRSRLVRETDKVAVYEVTLQVWEDVFAWGWLALPKDLAAGESRPVVVCQHGLEGLPEHCFETDTESRAFHAYQAFALRLAEQGFVTFAPHNPYRGGEAFRSLQRKLQPLGLSLYSVINGQHQRILDWLRGQSFVSPEKIAFYGLSYGGKSAMRTPAVLPGYCLSICSGDFNEWVRKCASTDLPMSYVFTGEYEIWEWNLGGTFNYAEMAALIAPRPFMVERGHNDGVGIDEWVDYEFAKVRRLYNKLGIGERARIEHFDGPHTIHGVGTFDFLRQHLQE